MPSALVAVVCLTSLVAACGDDDAPADAGPRDAATDVAPPMDVRTDVGAPDVGVPDTGSHDAGPADTGVAPMDAGVDGGPDDSGPRDTGIDGRFTMPCMATGECDPFVRGSCGDAGVCRVAPGGTSCEPVRALDEDAGFPRARGERCNRPEDCGDGLMCLDFLDGDGYRCYHMCATGSRGTCGAGEVCSGNVGDVCVRVCRPAPASCDVYRQDCAADAGVACGLARNAETDEPYTGCIAAGTRAAGQSCGGVNGACAAGHICVREATGGVCRAVCSDDAGAPPCAAGTTCTGVAAPWGVSYCG